MDDYDYVNDPYGLGEDYYGEGASSQSPSSSREADDSSGTATATEETPPVPALAICDSRRLTPVDLAAFEIPRKARTYSYSTPKKNSYTPSAAISYESSRSSILPLVDLGKPAGVSFETWQSLDADGFSRKMEPIRLSESPKAIKQNATEHTAVIQQSSPQTASGETPEVPDEPRDPSEMPFLDHLEEFRWALLKSISAITIAMILSWFVSDYMYGTLTRLAKNAELPLIATKVMEGVILKLQMALIMGIVVSLPFVFYFVWSFVAPGLYENEKRWVLPTVFLATFCFLGGASIAYFIIIPFVLPFVKNFLPPDVMPMVSIGNFVGTIIKFVLIFGVMFEMPLVTFALAKIGIVKYHWMSKYRKYAIVSIFIIGAILTPPDPISQMMMAVPLIILYEISILVARFAGRNSLI